MIERLAEVSGVDVSRETFEKIENYVALLVKENQHQNLVAASTIGEIWERHIIDSAQLIPLATPGSWLDIGSGAGLPGVVVALLTGAEIVLSEPRALRVKFLKAIKQALSLSKVEVTQSKPPALKAKFDNITARAVAPAAALLHMSHHLSYSGTTWLFPKGRSAQKELAAMRASWQGDFRLHPSRTDPMASILVGSNVRPGGTR